MLEFTFWNDWVYAYEKFLNISKLSLSVFFFSLKLSERQYNAT